jgi:hypothetical protein
MVTYSSQTCYHSSANRPYHSTQQPSKAQPASTEGTQRSASVLQSTLGTAHSATMACTPCAARIPARRILPLHPNTCHTSTINNEGCARPHTQTKRLNAAPGGSTCPPHRSGATARPSCSSTGAASSAVTADPESCTRGHLQAQRMVRSS